MSDRRSKTSADNGKKGGRPIATPTLIKQEFRKQLSEHIKKDMKSWINPIEDLAKGHFVEVEGKDGQVKVYKKSPDARAWNIAMDRAFGKPEETMDITTKGESISPFSDKAVELRQKFEEELRGNL